MTPGGMYGSPAPDACFHDNGVLTLMIIYVAVVVRFVSSSVFTIVFWPGSSRIRPVTEPELETDSSTVITLKHQGNGHCPSLGLWNINAMLLFLWPMLPSFTVLNSTVIQSCASTNVCLCWNLKTFFFHSLYCIWLTWSLYFRCQNRNSKVPFCFCHILIQCIVLCQLFSDL